MKYTPEEIILCSVYALGIVFALKIIYETKTWKELRDDVETGMFI